MNFRRSLAWMAGGQATSFVVQFTGSVILARLLSPYEFGVNALALAIVGVLYILQSVGLGAYVVREADLTPEKIAVASTVNMLISVLISIATLGLAFAGSLVAPDGNVRSVLMLTALTPLLNMFATIPFAVLERNGNFRAVSIVNIGRGVLTSVTAVLLALHGMSFYSLVIAQLVAAAANALALNAIAWQPNAYRPSINGWRMIGRFGAQMIATHGINVLAARSSEFALGRLRGVVDLGLFTRATAIFNLLWENIHLVINRVLFAEFARQKREGQSLRVLYLSTCEMMTATLWPLFTGGAVLAVPLIRIVYGNQWVGAALPFQLLAVSAIVLVSITMTWEVFVVSDATAMQARLEVVRTTVGTSLFIIGALHSLAAAAAARMIESVLSLFLYRRHLEHMTDTTLGDMIPIYLRSALLTLLAVGPAVGMMIMRGEAAGRSGPIALVGVIVAGGVLWIGGLIAMRHPLYGEVTRLLSARLRSRAASAPSSHFHGSGLE